MFTIKDSTYQNVVKDLFNNENAINDGVEIKRNNIAITQLLVY